MNSTGSVMAAAPIGGADDAQRTIQVSADGGANWTTPLGLPAGNWISVDMTPDGSRMVAVAFLGRMYLSNNSGQSWTQIDAAINPNGNLQYESVTISDDGQTIVAVDLFGTVYRSTNAGDAAPVVTTASVPGARFRAIDGSSTDPAVLRPGTTAFLVAASETGTLYRSDDGGASFTPFTITVDGAPVADNWYRATVSPDGSTIVLAGNTDFPTGAKVSTGVYVSRDRGATWARGGNTVGGTYSSLDTSANGDVIVATLSVPVVTDPAPAASAQVLLSTNGGTSFAPITAPAGDTNWRAAAITSDASRLLLAAGTFINATPGRVYLSSGSVTDQ